MIKFSKMFFTNPAKIWISNIKCSFNNVVKIIKVFNCEWMTMTIDSIAEGSALLTFVKKHNLEYAERHLSNCNIELSVLLPHTLLKEFLEKAFNEEPENIFIYNSFHMNCNMAFSGIVYVTSLTQLSVSATFHSSLKRYFFFPVFVIVMYSADLLSAPFSIYSTQYTFRS